MRNVDRIDVVSGGMFVAAGAWFVWQASAFRMGTLSAMGPAYLPTVLGTALIGLGALIVLHAWFQPMRLIESFGWRPLGFVLASMTVFALLIDRAGALLACFSSIFLVTFADPAFGMIRRLIVACVLTIVVTIIFVSLVGLPISVLPRW